MGKWAQVLAAVLLPALLSGCDGGGAGDQPSIYVLTLGHDQAPGHPYDQAAHKFAEGLEMATGGAIQLRVHPSSQLGDTAEQIEGLRMRSLDFSVAGFSHTSQLVPELGLFSAPFLFEDDAHFARVFDGEVGEILDKACHDRYGIRLLGTFTSGYRLLFNRKRPVNGVEDLAGLKIRVMSGEADALTWKAFGAIPTPMPYSECYSALQAGVVDGAENEPVSIFTNKFYETCPYFAITDHLVLPMGLFISSALFEELPAEYQQAVRVEARKAVAWEREYIAKRNKEVIDTLVSQYGVQVTRPDKTDFVEKGTPIQDRMAENLGLTDLLAKIREARRTP